MTKARSFKLQEDHGYTLRAYSPLWVFKIPGTQTLRAARRPRAPCVNSPAAEWPRAVPADSDELENAKRALIGSFALSLEDPQALLQNTTHAALRFACWTTGFVSAKVGAVTAVDVQRVAQVMVIRTR